LEESRDGAVLSGVVVTVADGVPSTIDYVVRADRHWHTREVTVHVTSPAEPDGRHLQLLADGDGLWWEVVQTESGPAKRLIVRITGCIDVDLAFSPITNTLPIRRYQLVVGASTQVTAAWVQFPSLELATLSQRYRRAGLTQFRYESFDHGFKAILDVDEVGLVRTYGPIWSRVAESDFSR
jgi:hypothetical protein